MKKAKKFTFKLPRNPKKRKTYILIGIIVAILAMPLWIFMVGGWLVWLVYKKIQNKKLKYALAGIIAIIFLFVGSAWANSFIHLSQSQSKTEIKSGIKPLATTENKENTKTYYTVAEVIDGDTFRVDINGTIQKVRLIGMDSPEVVDPRTIVQCFGQEASNKAKEILNNKKVALESDSTQGDKDKYNRLLRYAFLEDGTNFSQYMIREGYAHEYTYQVPYKYQSEFKQAEKDVRDAGKGLWASNTCNGDTTKSAATQNSNIIPVPSPATSSVSNDVMNPAVKKSSTSICHAKGTTYYDKTKTFTAYNTIEECLASGGRLPKR